MTTARLITALAARDFALGGNATLTLVSEKTGSRFTFKVRACEDNDSLFFVSLLNGADNESDFAYLGTIREGRFSHGKKSSIGPDAPSAKAFAWAWPQLAAGSMPAALAVYHEGRCGRCNRKLTVPESIVSGFGPECAGKLGAFRPLVCEAA
jgi:hypothetical protein